jgi:formylglycine-generating enzyme required for sulfatase activity
MGNYRNVRLIVSITFIFFSSATSGKNIMAETQQLTASMIAVPAGSFKMGSNDARVAEEPVHLVNIRAFEMAETEVTQQQWQAVMGANPAKFKGCDNCPVEQVSWDDVQTYLKKLNIRTGKQYRLPTEAEWEYACRSGGKNERYCGGNKRDKFSWDLRNSDKKPHEVKQRDPNGLGLYDMSGNVFEWTQDCWNANYEGAPTNGSAWLSGNCKERVLRGGSWNSFSTPGYMRSVYRFKHFTGSRFKVFGFRLVHDSSTTN